MQVILNRTFLILIILTLLHPSSLLASTQQRIALVIGNSAYSSGPLKNPVNDANAMAAQLEKLGFTVILKKNANLRTMEEALAEFGDRLKRGGVGLFFYAGHGLQVSGVNYLVPIGSKIDRESDIKYEALDGGKILDEMANANNGLNIVILDACRDNPFGKRFRNAARGLAMVSNAPVGTFISYSTGAGNVASDGDGKNSPYTAALLQYMKEPGLSIEQMFKKVRQSLGRQTGGKQIPWELSSLQGDFYFVTGAPKKGAVIVDESPTTTVADDLADENRKLEAEQRRLEEEKAAFAKKKAIDEKRQKIAEEKERLEAEKEEARQAELERKAAKKNATLAMAPRPSVSTSNVIGRDGRFTAYSNGTVLDTRTNLMWAAKDNGSDINWQGAKSYCENYRGGGYSDWRMPTQDELAGLHDSSKSYKATQRAYNVQLTELIQLSACCPWASETRGSEAADFHFGNGYRGWFPQSLDGFNRALPVRSGKYSETQISGTK